MDKFFAAQTKGKNEAAAATTAEPSADGPEHKKQLPKGVVIGKDGKPYAALPHRQPASNLQAPRLTMLPYKDAAPAPLPPTG